MHPSSRHTRFAGRATLLLALCLSPLGLAQDDAEPEPEANVEATPEPKPEPEPPRFASRAERDRQLLAERFPNEARWLPMAEPESDALALFHPAIAEPKGALLMFYSAENPPHWPPALANLRQALPRLGWATFALTLPPPDPEPVPERPVETLPQQAPPAAEEDPVAEADDAAEPNEEEAEEEAAAEEEALPEEPEVLPLPPRAERINQRVNDALAWLAEEGQGNLVVLVDPLSVQEVMAVLQPQLEAGAQGEPLDTGASPLSGPIRALILVNRADGVTLDIPALEQVFAVPELPVLDVFIGPTARLQQHQQRHRDVARRQRMANYQTLMLANPDVRNPDDERSFWVRRIQGFMHLQAEGQERRINRPD